MRSMRATQARMYAANSYSFVFALMYFRFGRFAYCSDSRWISCASLAISSLRWSSSRSTAAGRVGVSGFAVSVLTVNFDCFVVSISASVGASGLGAPFSSCTGAMPETAFGIALDSGSDGRFAFSAVPPPALFACARKSAFSGFSSLADCTRITSIDGSCGAGFSYSNVRPSASTPCAISENNSVTPRRSALPVPDAAIGLFRLQLRFDRIEQLTGDVKPERLVELADARRRCDVDLGQVRADHVEADEKHAAALQLGSDSGCNPAVAF